MKHSSETTGRNLEVKFDDPSSRSRRRQGFRPSSSPRPIQIVPSAKRLISSLRDLGYEFVQAVADVVDNSIAAGASRVRVDLQFEAEASWVRIHDNGCGMGADDLTEAMRYGSQRKYGDDELGKFGLGLKTASLSQCRRLIVLSRNGAGRGGPSARCLDLDHVATVDRWEITVPYRQSIAPAHRCLLEDATGTVVIWERLDRMLGFKLHSGGHARNALDSMRQQLSQHLSMVFHRYLAAEIPGTTHLEIKVNGISLEPWDPFGRDEKATEVLPARDFVLEVDGRHGLVRFQPYVLPAKAKLSNEAAFERLGGPSRWNSQQGLYVYRANRLIQSGGWNRLRALDEHVKLARASVDFFPELDAAFSVNVAKARVSLPSELRDQLRGPIEALAGRAQNVYRTSQPKSDERAAARSTVANAQDTQRAIQPQTIRRALMKAATLGGEQQALARIVKRLRKSDPEIARRLGWSL